MEENKLILLKLINHKEEVEDVKNVKNNLAKVLSEYFFISANSEGSNKIVLSFEKGDEKIKYIKEFRPMLRSEEKRENEYRRYIEEMDRIFDVKRKEGEKIKKFIIKKLETTTPSISVYEDKGNRIFEINFSLSEKEFKKLEKHLEAFFKKEALLRAYRSYCHLLNLTPS
jgi:hypothetical protein